MNPLPYCNFHMHSSDRSDGSIGTYELITESRKSKTGCLAITDHNMPIPEEELETLREAFLDVLIFQGCEFSVNYHGKEVHILGIDFRLTDEIKTFIAHNSVPEQLQQDYINTIIANLNKAGIAYAGSYDRLKKTYPNQRHIGRAVLAKDIVNKGILPSTEAVYDYIGDYGKRLAHTAKPMFFQEMHECIDVIRKSGGVVILAHPLSYGLSTNALYGLLDEFSSYGGMAVEAYYARYTSDQQKFIADLVKSRHPHLALSAGTDFHNWESDTLESQVYTNEVLPGLMASRLLGAQNVSVVSAHRIAADIKGSILSAGRVDLTEHIKPDVLIITALSALVGKEATQKEVLKLILKRQEQGKKTYFE